ncbi:DUF6716 putative glycosyltransferase [Microbacterium sp. HJ5]
MVDDAARRARQVEDSLTIGDHNDLDRRPLRALQGFAVLAGGVFRRHQRMSLPSLKGGLFVVANPVAHGARLAAAVSAALPAGMTVMADARLSDSSLALGASFPSLAPASMFGVVTAARVREALRLRRRLRRSGMRRGRDMFDVYLFLAQAVRFAAARDAVAGVGIGRVVIADFDRAAYAAPIVIAANEAAIRTASLVHGSPSARTYLPLYAAAVLPWGRVQADWFAVHSPSTVVHPVGRPDVDDVDAPVGESPRLIVCHSREELSEHEQHAILSRIESAATVGERVIVRLHPISASVGIEASWTRITARADDVTLGTEPLHEIVRRGDTVVVVSSTAALDAVARGVHAVVVADGGRALPADLAALAHADGGVLTRDDFVVARGVTAQQRIADALAAMTSTERP